MAQRPRSVQPKARIAPGSGRPQLMDHCSGTIPLMQNGGFLQRYPMMPSTFPQSGSNQFSQQCATFVPISCQPSQYLQRKQDHMSPCNQGGKKQSDQDFPQIQPDCTGKTAGLPDTLNTTPKKKTEPTMPTAEHNQDLKVVIHQTVPSVGEGKVEQSNKQEKVIIETVVESEKSIVTEEGTTVESEKMALPKKETKMNNVAEPPSLALKSLDSEEKVPKEKAKNKKLEDQNVKNKEGEPKPQDDKIGLKYTYRQDHMSPCYQGGKKQSDQDFPSQIQPDCTSKTTGLPDTLSTVPKKNGASSTTVRLLSWKGTSFKRQVTFVMLLSSLLALSSASNTVECLPVQYAPLRGRALVKCNGLGDFPLIYWFNNIEDDATALIKKENGHVRGSGYRAGDYNIDNKGSLVIYNVTIRDDRTFRVRVLDSDLIPSSDDVTLIVYIEPAKLLPEIPECSGQSTCILRGESERVISCIHGQSRPAMEVSWFLLDGRQDQLLNATVNQTESADSVTFTTSAQLAITEIPIDANMNQLLVLVCKTNQSVPGIKGSKKLVLLDFSVDVPVTNAENLDPAYALEREEEFKIKCQSEIDTANNVVLWMYKALNSEDFETILYSAYGEVAFTNKGEAGFNVTDDGALVIKKVDRQHEGYYACVSSFATTFVKNLEVIVLPKPPRIVVKGCEPLQTCHLSAQEAETITCTVNGVRPQVDLSIVPYSMNAAVTYTSVSNHKEGGVFYTTVEGHVDVSKVTCEENHVTVICQAQGPAAYGFMSDAYIMISVGGDDCAETSTDMVNPDDRSGYPLWVEVMTFLVVVVLVVLLIALLVYMIMSRNMDEREVVYQGRTENQRIEMEVLNESSES